MITKDTLQQLIEQIEKDLAVSTSTEDNEYHLAGLDSATRLLDYLS